MFVMLSSHNMLWLCVCIYIERATLGSCTIALSSVLEAIKEMAMFMPLSLSTLKAVKFLKYLDQGILTRPSCGELSVGDADHRLYFLVSVQPSPDFQSSSLSHPPFHSSIPSFRSDRDTQHLSFVRTPPKPFTSLLGGRRMREEWSKWRLIFAVDRSFCSLALNSIFMDLALT